MVDRESSERDMDRVVAEFNQDEVMVTMILLYARAGSSSDLSLVAADTIFVSQHSQQCLMRMEGVEELTILCLRAAFWPRSYTISQLAQH